MNIILNKQELQDALALASRAASVRTTMPILECVLLNAYEDGKLTISGSDKEISIDIAQIPAQVLEPGNIALDAKLFTEIVRKFSSDSISIETDEKFNAVCKGGRSRLKIAGQPGDEFPVVPESEINEINHVYTLQSNVLKKMINQTIFAVSQDQGKLILTGELMEIKNDILQIVAIDMFRIGYSKEEMPEGTPDTSAVVSGRAMNELSRMLPDDETLVRFFFTKNRVVFETENFRMVAILLDGDFIRYDQIHSEDFATMVIINRLNLLGALERAILIAVENRIIPISLDIRDDDIIINSQSERGLVEDGVPCQTEGKDLKIYFNPRYFIDALRVIDEEDVVLKFNTVLSPVTIRGKDAKNGHKYLIVPLRPPN